MDHVQQDTGPLEEEDETFLATSEDPYMQEAAVGDSLLQSVTEAHDEELESAAGAAATSGLGNQVWTSPSTGRKHLFPTDWSSRTQQAQKRWKRKHLTA